MAKRFTDSYKWQTNWFMSLTKDEKLLWLYMLDSCDSAGIFEPNWKMVSFVTDTDFTSFPESFNKQIIKTNHDRKVFIADFVKFQYGVLKETSNLHKKIHKTLKEYGIDIPLGEGGDTLPAPPNTQYTSNNTKDKVKRVSKDVSLNSIDDKFLDELQLKHIDVDVPLEFDKFKDYLSSKGKTFKDYQAGFRNWVKSPYVEKTDKIRGEIRRKREQEEFAKKEAKLREMEENGEIGVPEDFKNIVEGLSSKMNINKEKSQSR